MKFDVIVTAGCSFTVGANINNAEKKWAGKPYTFTALLGKRFNVPTVNLGKPGGSNDRIVRKVTDWILTNQQYQNPLFLIGISGLTRFEYWSHTENNYFDIHLFDWADDWDEELYKKQLETRVTRMLYPEADPEILKNWVKASQYMFNLPARRKQLASWVTLLDSHIKINNGTAIFFNSLIDDLVGVKERINFLSFPIKSTNLKLPDNDYRSRPHSALTDSWYHYLRQLHDEKYGNFESGTRSSVPPYGDYFCGGHPSPGGNIVIADLLEEKIKSL